jgi:hypothetical protein
MRAGSIITSEESTMANMNTGASPSFYRFRTGVRRTDEKNTFSDVANVRFFRTDGIALDASRYAEGIGSTGLQPIKVHEAVQATDSTLGPPRLDMGARLLGAIRTLEKIEALDSNWDSYGSRRPSRAAVAAARGLLWNAVQDIPLLVEHKDAVPFAVLPLSGDGVQLEWRRGGKALEVEIDAHGRMGYLLVGVGASARRPVEADDVPESQIIDLIKSVLA